MTGPLPTIVCPDCGGTAGLIQMLAADDELEPGDVVAYRCPDCLDRWDVVVTAEDLEDRDDRQNPDGGITV